MSIKQPVNIRVGHNSAEPYFPITAQVGKGLQSDANFAATAEQAIPATATISQSATSSLVANATAETAISQTVTTVNNLSSSLGFNATAGSQTLTGSKEGDETALEALASSANGLTNYQGWAVSGMDLNNTIYGVTTATIDGELRVTWLDLYDSNLAGTLPSEIGNLTACEYLNVKKNQFTGQIPSEIGNMSAMKYLTLCGRTHDNKAGVVFKSPVDGFFEQTRTQDNWDEYYHAGKFNSATNDFSGGIPATIGNLSNLVTLEAAHQTDNFGTTLPSEIGNCTNLKGLYTHRNHSWTGSVPSTINNLTNLRHMYLESCSLTGDFPDISALVDLKYFNIGNGPDGYNAITGNFPDITNFNRLLGIEVNANDMTGPFPDYLDNGDFTELEWFGFAWNDFTGQPPQDFGNLPNVFSIDISGMDLGPGLDWLTTINHGCIIMAIGWNDWDDTFPTNWGGVYWNLRNFDCRGCPNITGTINADFWNSIGYSDNLSRIQMAQCGFTGYDKEEFEAWIYNPVDGRGGSEGNCTGLTEIRLGDNNFDCSPYCLLQW